MMKQGATARSTITAAARCMTTAVVATTLLLPACGDGPPVAGDQSTVSTDQGSGTPAEAADEASDHEKTAGMAPAGARDDDEVGTWVSEDWELTLTTPTVIRGIAAGPTGLLAISEPGDEGEVLWASRDGLTWVPAASPPDRGEAPLTAVAATERGFVIASVSAGDDPGQLWESVDGITWTGPVALGPGARVEDVVGREQMLVAVGSSDDNASAWRSTSTGAWEEIPLPTEPGYESVADAVAAGPAGFVAAGHVAPPEYENLHQRRPALWRSADGISWDSVDLPINDADRGGLLTSLVWRDGFHAAGWDGVNGQEQRAIVYRSDDGRTWEPLTDPAFDRPEVSDKLIDLVPTANGLLAVGFEEYTQPSFGILWASDGETWQQIDVADGEPSFYGAAHLGDGRCAAAGGSYGEMPWTGVVLIGPCGPTGG